MRILVTGGTGFVGSALLQRLSGDGAHAVRAAVRKADAAVPVGVERVVVPDAGADAQWHEALAACEVVVHLAARVHVMHETTADPLAEFRRVNVLGTMNLARQAAGAGVQRFIYISSVKVNGERSLPGHPFGADDEPRPLDAYGISKREAESGLHQIARQTGLQVVVIRPPLVYGPGVKANFATMMRWLRRGVPLPFGAIDNRRSLVALDNLVDLIAVCLAHPAAANQTFMASDGEDLSTVALLQRLGEALGKPARLLPVPPWMLQAGAALLGRREVAQRLCESLQVDMEKTRRVLDWRPPVGVDEALRRVAQAFLKDISA